MSGRWIVIALLSFITAAVLIALGFVAPRLLPFTENLLAEAIGLATAFGLAVVVIEGRSLTQQARRRRIVAQTAKSTVAEASQIGMMLTWDLGTWLVSVLDSTVDLESEDLGDDWDADIKPLLCQIYDEAEALDVDAVLSEDALSYEYYRSWINGIKDYSQRIRHRIETNLDVHERLLELAEAFDRLDSTLTRSMWPSSIRTEVDRFHSLGRVGKALTRLMETIGTVYARL